MSRSLSLINTPFKIFSAWERMWLPNPSKHRLTRSQLHSPMRTAHKPLQRATIHTTLGMVLVRMHSKRVWPWCLDGASASERSLSVHPNSHSSPLLGELGSAATVGVRLRLPVVRRRLRHAHHVAVDERLCNSRDHPDAVAELCGRLGWPQWLWMWRIGRWRRIWWIWRQRFWTAWSKTNRCSARCSILTA